MATWCLCGVVAALATAPLCTRSALPASTVDRLPAIVQSVPMSWPSCLGGISFMDILRCGTRD